MSFSPASLLTQLMRFPVPQRYCVAFSGGCDSHVLLHALISIRQQLKCQNIIAVHINHGLHPESATWTKHCARICDEFAVPFNNIDVRVVAEKGESIEAVARDARYQALQSVIKDNDMLLLAHHLDDQAETIMLQLLRGAGVNGLSAMPIIADFSGGYMVRPLLEFTRTELFAYATENHLEWIEDPSNRETKFDRNYLRHSVMPLIKQRWPSASRTLFRASEHQAEAAELLEQLAQIDTEQVLDESSMAIDIAALCQFPQVRQKNLLRYWLKSICELTVPAAAHLNRILTEVVPAKEDSAPVVKWRGTEVRRYRGKLYALPPLSKHDAVWQCDWDFNQALQLPTGDRLVSLQTTGEGVRKEVLNDRVNVRYRQGGELCKLPGRKHHHELKKLFQEWGVPPWLRDRVPLIFLGDELAQIVGYSTCEPFTASAGESGINFAIQE